MLTHIQINKYFLWNVAGTKKNKACYTVTVTSGFVTLLRSLWRAHQVLWEGSGPPLSGRNLSDFTQEVIGLL